MRQKDSSYVFVLERDTPNIALAAPLAGVVIPPVQRWRWLGSASKLGVRL